MFLCHRFNLFKWNRHKTRNLMMSLILVAAVLWGTCCAKTKQNEKILWGCVSFFSLFCLEILLRRRSKWERWRLHMLIAWLILEWEWMRLVSKSSHIWATTSWLESLEAFKLKTESICSSTNCLFYFRRMCCCFFVVEGRPLNGQCWPTTV